MNNFLIPKKKFLELLILPIFLGIFYFLYPHTEGLVLFGFGFIWNWSASNDLAKLFENRRYRVSMIKLVYNMQQWILKPFSKAPFWVKHLIQVLPAGIFWSLIIFLNDSLMPWWATFAGSFAFELMQIELSFIKRYKEKQ